MASEGGTGRSKAPDAGRAASGRPRRPWWLLGAIVAVVAAVAIVRIGNGESQSEPRTRDVELTAGPTPPERLRVRVVNRYPHATDAFTQGLLWHDGHLYESTGRRGRSSVRRVELETGRVLEQRSVEPRLFAEGLARVGDRLIQLTWTAGEAHVWTLAGFEHVRRFEYEGEGWGLCFDGEHLVMSDGSDRLTFRDPATFEARRAVRVRDRGRPVGDLNELECVDGAVWANVWQTDRILRIDPRDGRVTATVDAGGLLDASERWRADVLNGIAWIPERERFVITGKLWPHLFEVDFVPQDEGD
jgi:glutaminyl-peptide cyclotransferase